MRDDFYSDSRPRRPKGKLIVAIVLVALVAGGLYAFSGGEEPAALPDTGTHTITLQPQAPLQESMEDQLARLRAECAKEVRSERVGDKEACNEYARLYAMHEPVATPGLAAPAARSEPAKESKDAPQPERAKIMVKYCDEFEFESSRHKECRALESARLRRRCEELREQAQKASEADLKTILPYQMAYCHEADRY